MGTEDSQFSPLRSHTLAYRSAVTILILGGFDLGRNIIFKNLAKLSYDTFQ